MTFICLLRFYVCCLSNLFVTITAISEAFDIHQEAFRRYIGIVLLILIRTIMPVISAIAKGSNYIIIYNGAISY